MDYDKNNDAAEATLKPAARTSRAPALRGHSWIPLRSLVARRLLRRPAALTDISSRSWTISPAEATSVPAAIYLDDGLDRVAGIGVSTTRENELRRVKGGRTEHAPTVAHEIRQAHLLDGNLYKGPWRWPLARGRVPLYSRGDCGFAGSGALACTLFGGIYFGHWMRDDLTLALAAEEIDEPLIVERAAFRHEPGYRELLGVHACAQAACAFDRIVVVEDFSQNACKRKRYDELRARLAARIPGAPLRRVYLRRGAIGAQDTRALSNGAEVESFLVGQGFGVVDPDRLSSEELCRHLRGARIVVGIEGSHLAHAIYTMADDGVICALQPPNRFNNIYKDYTDCVGMRYAFVVGAPARCGFVIELDDLARTLEKIDRECAV